MSKDVVLSLKNVSKVYQVGDQKIFALKKVSFDIHRGDFISIVGKSGSGKSTLMHIIGLLDSPTTGEVILNGVNVSKHEEKYLAKVRNEEIGFVFQSFNLLSRASALENVMLPLSYSSIPKKDWLKKSEEMLDLVDLRERMNNKSNELSGGQKQRVAIARALVNNPSIILADEPTGNLDSKTHLDNQLFSEFKGALAEQYVLQELKAAGQKNVFYWSNDTGAAELDFIFENNGTSHPVEVKANENLQAKSLKVFLQKYTEIKGWRSSLSRYRVEERFCNIPLYSVVKILDE
jgi:putative ABC transport system ATP-binding protein